jgi:hypothetical protein
MTTTEHLEKIKAKCVELLALAEKRTPGKWKLGHMPRDIYGTDGLPVASTAYPHTTQPRDQRIGMADAAYIAACAGAAEAGWRAIAEESDGLISILTLREVSGESVQGYAFRRAKQLIAAWREELL